MAVCSVSCREGLNSVSPQARQISVSVFDIFGAHAIAASGINSTANLIGTLTVGLQLSVAFVCAALRAGARKGGQDCQCPHQRTGKITPQTRQMAC
jgi:hypothetical protein